MGEAAAPGCCLSPRRGSGFLATGPQFGSGPPGGAGLSPLPRQAPRSPGPRTPGREPRCGLGARPGGGAGVGGGDPGRLQLPTAVSTTPARLRGRAGTGRARGGTTSLFPPGLRPLGLKRVFPVGLPNPGWRAQPPGTRPEWRVTPPRPRARPGREVEPLVTEGRARVRGSELLGLFTSTPRPQTIRCHNFTEPQADNPCGKTNVLPQSHGLSCPQAPPVAGACWPSANGAPQVTGKHSGLFKKRVGLKM
ncbi:decreased expression in renal and prostate cancer protein-like [Mustela erminea]|uniref:decreased expression in renal and prostate cancer protein-like n=1 Tax=Mustela erminea TaxID=36723 RepID=UPI0013872DBF|nr:decreased expression in renal and prostate cancer protein-like [Mustela erminea]